MNIQLVLIGLTVSVGLSATPATMCGQIFVTNSGNNNVFGTSIGEFTTSGGTVNASLITGLARPFYIALSGNDLFVTNYGANTIGEYTTSGAAVNPALVTGLGGPTGIAISGQKLFVANYGTTPGTGTIGEYTISGETVDAYRRDLRTLFSFCITRGYCPENPVIGSQLAKAIDSPIGVLTPDQLSILLKNGNPLVVPYIAIGVFADLRAAEIERLDGSRNLSRERFL